MCHEARLNQEEESMTNYFSTQYSLSKDRGRGGWGRGRRGKRLPHKHKINSHKHLNHWEHSHNSQHQRGRGKKLTDKSNIHCNYFKKYGHHERECKKKEDERNSGKSNFSKEEEGLSRVMFLSNPATEEHHHSGLWLLDNDCNNHMTDNKWLFSNKTKRFVLVFTNKNENNFIHEAFYVPHMKSNLIVIAQLL